MNSAETLISTLELAPHPEGGWYRETWRSGVTDANGRPSGTAILFLLCAQERSHWHRVDADEIWHFHAGAPLNMRLSPDKAGPAREHVLGPDPGAGQTPQLVVPANHWQSAESTGDWTLVGCTVSPGFLFEGFELAPPDFTIG